MATRNLIIGVTIFGAIVATYLAFAPKASEPSEPTLKSLLDLRASIAKKYPKSQIREYKDITEEVIKNGMMPDTFVKNGASANAWGGRILVQLFPKHAWKTTVPATINYVLESVPQSDCSFLVGKLGGQTDARLFQINVEPSKKVHHEFPVSGGTGCSAGLNNLGYAVYAD